MMRSSDYARTPPEPPEGLVLVVVLVIAAIIERTYGQISTYRQLHEAGNSPIRLYRTALLRDKRLT